MVNSVHLRGTTQGSGNGEKLIENPPSRLITGLNKHIQENCQDTGINRPTDFSGEQCHDAFLMLQEALNGSS
jgi:hypothetical protein|tara:strand:+ start:520 stop:735 length:216 start_codon:yes stop_codon:yes gene_type:complete